MYRIVNGLLKTVIHLILVTLLIAGYGISGGVLHSKRLWSDGLAIMGICYLVVSLFRLVRQIGFFDLAIFSTKKFWEITTTRDYAVSNAKYGDFIAYKKENPYTKAFAELLITAIILLVASLILILL